MNTAATLPTPSPFRIVPTAELFSLHQRAFMRAHAVLDVQKWQVVGLDVAATTVGGSVVAISFSELDDLCERGLMTQHGPGRFDVSLTDAGRELVQ